MILFKVQMLEICSATVKKDRLLLVDREWFSWWESCSSGTLSVLVKNPCFWLQVMPRTFLADESACNSRKQQGIASNSLWCLFTAKWFIFDEWLSFVKSVEKNNDLASALYQVIIPGKQEFLISSVICCGHRGFPLHYCWCQTAQLHSRMVVLLLFFDWRGQAQHLQNATLCAACIALCTQLGLQVPQCPHCRLER